MNEHPPEPDRPEAVDAQYRRISARDVSRPSEHVRRAVLAHAAQLASERARGGTRAPEATVAYGRRAAWRPVALGAVAAGILGVLIIAPRFMVPAAPEVAAETTAAAPALGEAALQPGAPRSAPLDTAALRRDLERTAHAGAAESRTAARAPRVADAARKSAASEAAAPEVAPPPNPGPSQAADQAAPARLEAPTRAPGRARAENAAPAAFDGAALGTLNTTATESSAALHRAATSGDVAALEVLLAGHPDVEARDALGRTALYLAALHGERGAVEMLLAHGADANAADARGMTPLQAASSGNQAAIAELLRRHGAH